MYNAIYPYTNIHVTHYICMRVRGCVCVFVCVHIYMYTSSFHSLISSKRVPPYAKSYRYIYRIYISGESAEGADITYQAMLYVGKNCHEVRRDCMMPVRYVTLSLSLSLL